MEKLDLIIRLLEFILTLAGIIIPLVIVIISWRDKKRRQLAEQVIAYYYLQDEAVNEIAKITSQAPQTVKKQLRDKACHHPENKRCIYPNMTAKEAEDFMPTI